MTPYGVRRGEGSEATGVVVVSCARFKYPHLTQTLRAVNRMAPIPIQVEASRGNTFLGALLARPLSG